MISTAFPLSSGFSSRSRRFERNKKCSSPSTPKTQYCGEPLWPRGSVLGLRPPGFEFRILCLEGSVISLISPSSRGSPAQFGLCVHKSGLKHDSFHFIFLPCTDQCWYQHKHHLATTTPPPLHYSVEGGVVVARGCLWYQAFRGVRQPDCWRLLAVSGWLR